MGKTNHLIAISHTVNDEDTMKNVHTYIYTILYLKICTQSIEKFASAYNAKSENHEFADYYSKDEHFCK